MGLGIITTIIIFIFAVIWIAWSKKKDTESKKRKNKRWIRTKGRK